MFGPDMHAVFPAGCLQSLTWFADRRCVNDEHQNKKAAYTLLSRSPSGHPPLNNGETMKRFVIVTPRPGRTTVSLVAYQYNEETKRTKTVYAGSFPLSLDPALLKEATLLAPGQSRHGLRLSERSPISLNQDEIAVIRRWLEVHGSVAALARLQEEETAKKASERANLRAVLTSEVKAELLASIRVRDVLGIRLKALREKLVRAWQIVLRKGARDSQQAKSREG